MESIWVSYNSFGLKGVELIAGLSVAQANISPFKYVLCKSGGNKLGDEGVRALMKYDWSNLKKIFLSGCSISDEGLELLCVSDWPNLELLKLNRNRITSRGVVELSRKEWKRLEMIHMRDNKIDDEGGKMIVEGEWPSLKTIQLGTYAAMQTEMAFRRRSRKD